MAKRDKDRLYYEITREKPFGTLQMLMVGGSAGSVLSFLIVSLVGAYEGTNMDSLVLAFLVASFLGFFFGLLLTWLFTRYFEGLVSFSPLVAVPTEKPEPIVETAIPMEQEPNSTIENEEAKGKSVDFIFPELSPDKQ